MSHNPNTVKSQDELNDGGRKSDVLIATIEELERTKKQLDIALDCLKEFADSDNWDIAINDNFIFCYEPKPKYPWRFAIEVLKQIDEINGEK